MSRKLETQFSIPLRIDDSYTPQEILRMSRVLKQHCARLEETVGSRLIIKKDAMDIASELYEMVERLGWYVLGQIEQKKLKGTNIRQEIVGNATEMHTLLTQIMRRESPKGFKYVTTEATRELEEAYSRLVS
jgi:hypothetical protein